MNAAASFSAFCLTAPASGGGKTSLAVALMRALCLRGLAVQGFKCGPDYVDPTFHRQATGRPSYNLDTWMMGHSGVRALWQRHTAKADAAICEGVMGLFDGREGLGGAGSTADCAAALDLPLILIVPCRGMAASIAPLVAGFSSFAARQGLRLAGVIANNVGSARHSRILERALEEEGLPPLLGTLPRREDWRLPERQLGLVPAPEYAESGASPDASPGASSDASSGQGAAWLTALAQAAEDFIDIPRLLALTRQARQTCQTRGPGPACPEEAEPASLPRPASRKRLALARDQAFCFYYEENGRLLQTQGWELVPFSPLADADLPPDTDALWLGGGYPELFAASLAANASMLRSIRTFADGGGEIYAECGGYMYLCEELITADGERFPLLGLIRGTARMGASLRSLGYREVHLLTRLPFGLEGPPLLRGHEFHWSEIELHQAYPPLYESRDKEGLCQTGGIAQSNIRANIRASYVHLYWGGLA